MSEGRVNPVKLEDIAKILNVTKVTVSKALRDHPDISVKTRNKIKKLAHELGYIPNPMARQLSAGKSNIIGLVFPQLAHYFFGSVIEAIYDTANENNYETFITVSHEQAEREKQNIQSLLSMRVDGLIVSITEQTKDFSVFKRVLDMNIPIVFIDRIPSIKNVPTVTVDDKGGAYMAVQHFVKKGFTKIGLFGGYQYINIGRERLKGFNSAMKKYGLNIHKNWIIEGGFGEEDGYKGFKKLLKNKKLPEAILAVAYPVALGIYEAAVEAGIKIPDDLMVTCFNNNVFKYKIPSVFNYVDQPTMQLGREAVQLLCNLIKNPDSVTEKNIELKTRLLLNGRDYI